MAGGRWVASVEEISASGITLAFVITHDVTAEAGSFFTTDESAFQAGFVVYPAGGRVDAHVHHPIERRIIGTAEYLQVRRGRCVVDIYSQDRHLIASRTLGPGDAVLSLTGGHGFRMLQDT